MIKQETNGESFPIYSGAKSLRISGDTNTLPNASIRNARSRSAFAVLFGPRPGNAITGPPAQDRAEIKLHFINETRVERLAEHIAAAFDQHAGDTAFAQIFSARQPEISLCRSAFVQPGESENKRARRGSLPERVSTTRHGCRARRAPRTVKRGLSARTFPLQREPRPRAREAHVHGGVAERPVIQRGSSAGPRQVDHQATSRILR